MDVGEQQLSDELVDIWAATQEYVRTGKMPENVDSRTKENILSLSKLLRRRDLAMKLLLTKSTLIDAHTRQAKQYAQFCDAYERAHLNTSLSTAKVQASMHSNRTAARKLDVLKANINGQRETLYIELDKNLSSIWQDFEQWYKEDYKRAQIFKPSRQSISEWIHDKPDTLNLPFLTGEYIVGEETVQERRNLHRKSKPFAIKNEQVYERLIQLVQDAGGTETATVYKSYLDAMRNGVKRLSKAYDVKSSLWFRHNTQFIADETRALGGYLGQMREAKAGIDETEKNISQLNKTIAIMKPMYVIAVIGDVLEELGQNLMYSA